MEVVGVCFVMWSISKGWVALGVPQVWKVELQSEDEIKSLPNGGTARAGVAAILQQRVVKTAHGQRTAM